MEVQLIGRNWEAMLIVKDWREALRKAFPQGWALCPYYEEGAVNVRYVAKDGRPFNIYVRSLTSANDDHLTLKTTKRKAFLN